MENNNETIYCACGCLTTLEKFDSRGRERKFISGHNGVKYKDATTRDCNKCFINKPFSEFYKNASYCKNCISILFKEHYKENKEEIKQRALEWNKANVERKRLYNRNRASGMRKELRVKASEWAKNNPAKRRLYGFTRESKKKYNGGSFTRQEWLTLCEKYGNKCLSCGSTGLLQADHVIPLALGGSNTIDNIQPLCGPCNFHKHLASNDFRPEKGTFLK